MASKKARPAYHRVLLKLSGEALLGDRSFGIDRGFLDYLASELQQIHALGIEVAAVVGGGNISADHMGMLATVINGLALQDALERRGIFTRVLSAIEMREVAEPFIRRRAIRHLEKGRLVIFAGGIGNPYFSTDTAAALRAMEIKAEVILKGTKVDGVYDDDPAKNKKARRYERVSYLEVLQRGLKVMDTTAISLCMDNRMPIVVFDLKRAGNLLRLARGERVGTLVEE